MLNGEKQGFSMEKGIESDARQAKNARFSMLNGKKQGFSMEKAKCPRSITLICRPKGRSAPLACCLPHADGWKRGQGQATRWVVACRGASEPLDGAANRWHPRPKGKVLSSTNTSL